MIYVYYQHPSRKHRENRVLKILPGKGKKHDLAVCGGSGYSFKCPVWILAGKCREIFCSLVSFGSSSHPGDHIFQNSFQAWLGTVNVPFIDRSLFPRASLGGKNQELFK